MLKTAEKTCRTNQNICCGRDCWINFGLAWDSAVKVFKGIFWSGGGMAGLYDKDRPKHYSNKKSRGKPSTNMNSYVIGSNCS